MNKNCVKCNRQFPWGISSQDSVCFVCRWPSMWNERDERYYRNRLEELRPPATKKVLTPT